MKSPFKQTTSSFLNNRDTDNKNSYLNFKNYHFENNLNLPNYNQSNIKNNYPRQNYLKNNLSIINETMSNNSSNNKNNNENILEENQFRYYQHNIKNFQRPIYHNYNEKDNSKIKNEFLSKKIFLINFRY